MCLQMFTDADTTQHCAHCMNPWVWNGLSRGTGGWAEWSHHHQLDGHHHHQQMALVPPWWWVRDDIFPSNAMQPFSPTILTLPSSSSASVVSLSWSVYHTTGVTPANSWSTSRYAQVHPKMLQKKTKFPFLEDLCPLGRFIGSPYIVPPKSAAQSKVAPRKRFTTPEFKYWSLLLWKIGYTLELSGSSQETILLVVLFSSF